MCSQLVFCQVGQVELSWLMATLVVFEDYMSFMLRQGEEFSCGLLYWVVLLGAFTIMLWNWSAAVVYVYKPARRSRRLPMLVLEIIFPEFVPRFFLCSPKDEATEYVSVLSVRVHKNLLYGTKL